MRSLVLVLAFPLILHACGKSASAPAGSSDLQDTGAFAGVISAPNFLVASANQKLTQICQTQHLTPQQAEGRLEWAQWCGRISENQARAMACTNFGPDTCQPRAQVLYPVFRSASLDNPINWTEPNGYRAPVYGTFGGTPIMASNCGLPAGYQFVGACDL